MRNDNVPNLSKYDTPLYNFCHAMFLKQSKYFLNYSNCVTG